jgi:nucleotide-binding universal stress UspA family protein
MTVKPIVVGLKEKQPTALRFATEMAIAHNVGVRVIHCLDIRSAGDFVSMPHDSWRAAGAAILEDAGRIIDDVHPHPTTEYRLDSGLPFYTLRDESDNATMVVVGIDSAGRKQGVFGGTVTDRLAAHSPVPVAIVPERSWPHDPSGTVVVAVDARTPAPGPLGFAFAEASRRNAELQAVHVVPVTDMFGDTLPHRVGLSEALAGWAEEFPDVKVSRRFLFDDADEGCVRVTDEADLLILGRGPTTVMNQLLGHPVLSEITTRAHCPCVVVPDDWEGR